MASALRRGRPLTPPPRARLPSGAAPHQTLQPHDTVSGNTKRKKKELTTIYTQNSQGLWRCPRNAEGNILVNHLPDLLKLGYIIDFMPQHDVGAWLLQEIWEESDEFDINIGGYHIF